MGGMTKLTLEQEAREWRDEELLRTDIAATVSDFPNADAILIYRQTLRDWPSTADFPYHRPSPTAPAAEQAAITWRDGELDSTDHIMADMDNPKREAYLTYRSALINWPMTADFPNTRPELKE